MKIIKERFRPKTIAILRWVTVLPAAIGITFLLLLPISLAYSNPFLDYLPPAVITYGRSALMVCIALTVAAITAPSRKQLTFWATFAIWIGLEIARSTNLPPDNSIFSWPKPNLLIKLITYSACALVTFLFLHYRKFQIIPKKWHARTGIILGLYALTAFFHLYPTLQVWKLRTITRHHPEIIQHQLFISAVNYFGYSKVSPIKALPKDLRPLQEQAISEAHRLNGAAGMTPYFFKISNKHGIWYCLFAHKQTSQISSCARLWMSEEHGVTQSGWSRSGSLDDVDHLPERVCDSLTDFHLFYASDCTPLDSLPNKFLKWHPNLPELIEKYVQPNHSDAFYFKNEHNDYLLVLAWDKENLTSCLRLNANEVLALDQENYRAFVNVKTIDSKGESTSPIK